MQVQPCKEFEPFVLKSEFVHLRASNRMEFNKVILMTPNFNFFALWILKLKLDKSSWPILTVGSQSLLVPGFQSFMQSLQIETDANQIFFSQNHFEEVAWNFSVKFHLFWLIQNFGREFSVWLRKFENLSKIQDGEGNRTNQSFFKWNPWISLASLMTVKCNTVKIHPD